MENLINLISSLSQNKTTSPTSQPNIPKEILEQYPYGDFPIRYTKVGQEVLRSNSENRFAYQETPLEKQPSETTLDFKSLIPLLQVLTNKNHSSKDMFNVFSQLLFKDKPEFKPIIDLLSRTTTQPIKNQEIDNRDTFPNTNTVSISSLQKIKNT